MTSTAYTVRANGRLVELGTRTSWDEAIHLARGYWNMTPQVVADQDSSTYTLLVHGTAVGTLTVEREAGRDIAARLQAAADDEAEALRVATGSTAATVRHERRLSTGELVVEAEATSSREACVVDGCVAAAAGRWDVIARPTSYRALPLCRAHVAEHRAAPQVSAVRPAAA